MSKTTVDAADARIEAIVRAGVHVAHEFSRGVVVLYSTRVPHGFAVDRHRNMEKSICTLHDDFAEAYGAFLAATEAEIVRQGGKFSEVST